MRSATRVATAIACGVLGLCLTATRAATIDEVMIQPRNLGSECSTIKGEHPVSAQASRHYATVEESSFSGAVPRHKSFQSFDCAGIKSTVYYYEYPTRSDLDDMKGLVEARIWGGRTRSSAHPDLILAVDNVLVVISSLKPKRFKKHLGR